MKAINATRIGNLISAHYEHDEEKFNSYVKFIIEAYEEQGEQHKGIYYHIDDTHIATEEELKAAKEPFLAEKREKAKKRELLKKPQGKKKKLIGYVLRMPASS